MLTVQDSRLVVVTLEGLENILKVGNNNLVQGVNPFGMKIEEAYGLFVFPHFSLYYLCVLLFQALIRLSTYKHMLMIEFTNLLDEY